MVFLAVPPSYYLPPPLYFERLVLSGLKIYLENNYGKKKFPLKKLLKFSLCLKLFDFFFSLEKLYFCLVASPQSPPPPL